MCTFETADVSFRVARLLLVEHNVTMHAVEPSAGDVELYEFLKVKMKEDQDSEAYEECKAYNYAVNEQRAEQEQYFESQWCDTSAIMDMTAEGDTAMGNTSTVVDRTSGGGGDHQEPS